MKSKIIILIISVIYIVGTTACDSMDDNYKQYLEETNYSGKVTQLQALAGNERILLKWENPKDQKSKKIKVVYGEDNQEKVFDSLVDSAMIDGLGLSSYVFNVYTMDVYGNLSIPVTISKSPYGAAHIKSLEPPRCSIHKQDNGKYTIQLANVSSALMKFGGKVDYRIKGTDNTTNSGTFTTEANLAFADTNIKDIELQEGIEYTIEYDVTVYPALLKNKKPDGTLEYTEISFDTTVISGSKTVNP